MPTDIEWWEQQQNIPCLSTQIRWLYSLQNIQVWSTGNLLGGPLLCPAYSRARLISSYFSWLQDREQAKERKENELSALLKRFMISHTHSQARSLPDTTPLISRPENWRASHSWATALSLAGPGGPTMPCVLPYPATRKASWGRSRWNWIPMC